MCLVLVLILTATITIAASSPKSDDSYLNIPDQFIVFNDESALTKKENLQSKQYNDFIHTLYKFDADNLQKFDALHDASEANRHKRNISVQQAPRFIADSNNRA